MNPINILKYGAEEEKSESARMVSRKNLPSICSRICCINWEHFIFIFIYSILFLYIRFQHTYTTPRTKVYIYIYLYLYQYRIYIYMYVFLYQNELMVNTRQIDTCRCYFGFLCHQCVTLDYTLPKMFLFLSVILCWCYCNRRSCQNNFGTKGNGEHENEIDTV